MNLNSTLSRIDVLLQVDHTEWWHVAGTLTPLAALVTMGFAIRIALHAGRRRPEDAGTDMPFDWWSRAEWAMDMAMDGSAEKRQVGLAVLDRLIADRSVSNLDRQIVTQAYALLDHK